MRKVSRSEDSINNNIKEVMAKEAGIADIPHNIVTHLPTLIPTVAAEAGLLTGLVKNIKNRNKTAPNPTPGTDEAYNATGFMSPSQIQNYKNKDAVEKDSSFEERYATDDPLAFAHSLQTAPKQKDQNQPILEPSEAVEGEGIGALGELAALSSKTAGAWPSETDWDGHLHNLEELLAETQKGVGWHAAKDEKKEMKAHDKLAKDLQKVIDDIKKVMKFPAAKTASVETDDWRDDHSNLDSDW